MGCVCSDKLMEINNKEVEKDLFSDQIKALTKEKNIIKKELDSKSSYFETLYIDRANGILNDNELYILKNKFNDDIIANKLGYSLGYYYTKKKRAITRFAIALGY